MKLRVFFGLFVLVLLLVSAVSPFSPGVVAQSEPAAGLLITELYYDPSGTEAEQEWIEIANVGTAVIDLSDVKVGDEEEFGGGEGMKRFPDGSQIEPGQVVVIAQTAVGFRALYGRNPDYELAPTDENVPTLRNHFVWATGDLALANDGDELLLLDERDDVLDAVNYGDVTTYFAPSIIDVFEGQSVERVPGNCDTDTAADWQPQQTPTPGIVVLSDECAEPINPANLETLPSIGQIQGNGDVAAAVNEIVSFRGVVTGILEDINASGVIFYTAFVQDLPGHEDGDPTTSDGIALFLGRQRPSFQIGDQVRVTGLVTEFFGLSELDDNDLEILVEASDVPLPEPAPIAPPADNADQLAYFEPLEGMRVTIDGAATVVGATFSGCSFAVVADADVSPPLIRQSTTDSVGQIVPVLHTSDVDCGAFPHVKSGDRVAGLVGPLTYHFDQFKIVHQQPEDLDVTAVPLPSLPSPPSLAENQFSLATFNVENHFDSIDDTGDAAEPKPSAAEISLKQQKLAYAISQTLGCPTLIGVQEVEKASLLHDLAAETAAACSFTYQVTHLESADVRGIDVALLSDPNRVTVLAADLQQTCTEIDTGIIDPTIDCPAGAWPLFSRPPLLVTLTVDGQPLTVMVNHFKSKRGGELETAPRRVAQAQHINRLVADLLDRDAGAWIVVMGDFNDYDRSPALLEMTENGRLTNVLSQVPQAQRYSFVFSGAAQLIDGVLASPALADAVDTVAIQHVNADYPDAWSRDVSPERIAYKGTDHDLPLVLFSLPPGVAATSVSAATVTATPVLPATPLPTPESTTGTSGWLLWLLGGVGLVGVGGTAVFLWRRQN